MKKKLWLNRRGDKDETDDKEQKDTFDDISPVSFFQLFRYATGWDKLLIFFGVLCTIGTGTCVPLNLLIFGDVTKEIIDFATTILDSALTQAQKDEASDKLIDVLKSFAIYNSMVGTTMLVLSYFSTMIFNYTAVRQIFKIRHLYLKSALNQDIGWFDLHQTGDFASRMAGDLGKIEDGLGEKVALFFHFQVTFLVSLVMAYVKGWKLALVCTSSFPATMITMGIVTVLTSKLSKRETDLYGIAGAIAEEVFTAVRTVVAFGGQKKELDRYSNQLVAAKRVNIFKSLLMGTGFGLLWFFIFSSYALAFWYGVGLVLDDRTLPTEEIVYDPGNMVLVFFGVMTANMNLGLSAPYMEVFGSAKGAAAKIYDVIDNTPTINSCKGHGKRPSKITGNIVFKNVHFQYPSRPDVKILQGLNLTIKAGETVALVGTSGCGKSTCIQLMQRFYDPANGNIYLDDEDLAGLDLTWLRSNIGVVGQEPALFGMTIAENIKFGNPNAIWEDVEIAAKKANAHSFITTLPQGYDTLVGEKGTQLSGGQKQRIAIARALVRNPAILLLDEATSALDINSEAKVQAALDSASKGFTTIIVAHRLSTIRHADKIVVLSEGKLEEQGSHDELMEKKGAYYNLVTTQATPGDLSLANEDEDDFIPIEVKKKLSNVPSDINMADQYDDNDESTGTSLFAIMKVNKPEWWSLLIGSIASIGTGATMPVFAIIFGDIISVLANPDEDIVRNESNQYCLYFVLAGICIGTAFFFQIYMFGIAGEKLTQRLRHRMFDAMLKQEMGWYDNKDNAVGSLCARLAGEAANVQGATGQRIATIIQSISTLILAIMVALYNEWRLGLLALAFTPVILVATFFQQRLMNVENTNARKALENSTKTAVEGVSNIRTVASLGCEQIFESLYVEQLLPHHKLAKRNTHVKAIVLAIARSIIFYAYAACIFYGGILVINEGMHISKVFTVSQAVVMGTVNIANALAFTPNLSKGLQAATKIFNLLNRVPLIRDGPYGEITKQEHGSIDYSRVYFSYPTRPNIMVLKGLDLSIIEGKTVALVGPSGCGKSTLLQLLQRFYDPVHGTVNVGNEDIKDMTLQKLRLQLGVVSQEPNLFDRTIEENIAYGDNTRVVGRTEVIEAAKSANIHTFIASLPLGYDTRLGERGTQLSGGQKQRVAIARALVRHPKVLLLDEATSALDTESEKVVQEALDNARKGRTCITIAHRLTTIQDSDVICVVDHGIVTEMGSHSELLGQKGLYYQLHKLQGGAGHSHSQ